MQVGEVLDFGDGEQARRSGTNGQAEDRLFVEEGVENLCRANPFRQPTGVALDAALAGDILADDECFRVVGEASSSARLMACARVIGLSSAVVLATLTRRRPCWRRVSAPSQWFSNCIATEANSRRHWKIAPWLELG